MSFLEEYDALDSSQPQEPMGLRPVLIRHEDRHVHNATAHGLA